MIYVTDEAMFSLPSAIDKSPFGSYYVLLCVGVFMGLRINFGQIVNLEPWRRVCSSSSTRLLNGNSRKHPAVHIQFNEQTQRYSMVILWACSWYLPADMTGLHD